MLVIKIPYQVILRVDFDSCLSYDQSQNRLLVIRQYYYRDVLNLIKTILYHMGAVSPLVWVCNRTASTVEPPLLMGSFFRVKAKTEREHKLLPFQQ